VIDATSPTTQKLPREGERHGKHRHRPISGIQI
jgi:hypothetical protein